MGARTDRRTGSRRRDWRGPASQAAVDASLIKADADRQKGVEATNGLPPESVSRAAREYLAVLAAAAFGAAAPVVPKLACTAGELASFASAANDLIDLDQRSSWTSSRPPRSGRPRSRPPSA